MQYAKLPSINDENRGTVIELIRAYETATHITPHKTSLLETFIESVGGLFKKNETGCEPHMVYSIIFELTKALASSPSFLKNIPEEHIRKDVLNVMFGLCKVFNDLKSDDQIVDALLIPYWNDVREELSNEAIQHHLKKAAFEFSDVEKLQEYARHYDADKIVDEIKELEEQVFTEFVESPAVETLAVKKENAGVSKAEKDSKQIASPQIAA